MSQHLARVQALAVPTLAAITLLLAGCSSSDGTAAAADPPAKPSSTTAAPSSTATTTPPDDLATPLDGIWVTRPLTRQRIEAVFARAGLTKYLGVVMPEVVKLPASMSMTIANGQESLQMIASDEAPANYDHESVEVSGHRLTIAPIRDGATGHSIYQWTLRGDNLVLLLIGTTEPVYEGIPAETWQRLLYTAGTFHRQ